MASLSFLHMPLVQVNAKNNERKTPLHLLVERRWADLAKWLVYQQADPYLKDKYGKDPLR